MTLLDYIDVIDDIIDLSSDEEAVQQDYNATQPHATLLVKQAVFVLAGEERQDEEAAFVLAGEGSQEANESGNALVATASPSVVEKVSLDTAEPKDCPMSPTSAPLPSLTSTSPKAVTSEVGDTQLVATASPSAMKEVPLDTTEAKNCPFPPRTAPFPSPAFTTPKDLTSEVGDTQLVATTSPSVMEKALLYTAESKNSSSSQTSAPFPSPASTTLKAVTSEFGDTKLVRLKRPKKYQTSTPRRSPRFEQKCECSDSPVEEPAADPKRSRMLERAEESASSANTAGSTKTVSTEY